MPPLRVHLITLSVISPSTSKRDDVDGEYRAMLMHTIRDLTADAYGGWKFVTNIQAGGGLYAQRIVTRRHYDMDRAKQAALALTGMSENDAH